MKHKLNTGFLCLVNCFAIKYYLLNEVCSVNAESNGLFDQPICALPLKISALINETVALVWDPIPAVSCGNAPELGYSQSLALCNAGLFSNETKSIILPTASSLTSICQPDMNQIYIYSANQSLDLFSTFNAFITCLKNQTFIQTQCLEREAAKSDWQKNILLPFIVILVVMGCCIFIGKWLHDKHSATPNNPSQTNQPNANVRTHLLGQTEMKVRDIEQGDDLDNSFRS